MPDEPTTRCGWGDRCCGGDPQGCRQPGEERFEPMRHPRQAITSHEAADVSRNSGNVSFARQSTAGDGGESTSYNAGDGRADHARTGSATEPTRVETECQGASPVSVEEARSPERGVPGEPGRMMRVPSARYSDSTGWQPISTAPTDGTRILAWPCYSRGVHVVAWGGRRPPCWRDDRGRVPVQPTHWMPLPPPPREPTDGR